MIKICKTCNKELNISNFYYQTKKSGNKIYNPNCKTCVIYKSKKWITCNKVKRKKHLDEWKLLNIDKNIKNGKYKFRINKLKFLKIHNNIYLFNSISSYKKELLKT